MDLNPNRSLKINRKVINEETVWSEMITALTQAQQEDEQIIFGDNLSEQIASLSPSKICSRVYKEENFFILLSLFVFNDLALISLFVELILSFTRLKMISNDNKTTYRFECKLKENDFKALVATESY